MVVCDVAPPAGLPTSSSVAAEGGPGSISALAASAKTISRPMDYTVGGAVKGFYTGNTYCLPVPDGVAELMVQGLPGDSVSVDVFCQGKVDCNGDSEFRRETGSAYIAFLYFPEKSGQGAADEPVWMQVVLPEMTGARTYHLRVRHI